LVPKDLTAFHFNYIIRKRISLPEREALHFFVAGTHLLKGDTLILQAYEKLKDQDGFLYIMYTEETTMGEREEEK
jgi:GABA(A) receptor-associated protein